MRRLPDGAGNCDAFGGVFFPAATALCCQRFKLFKQSAGGASEHLKCDLACESTQTALVEIRLDEHDWSQTNNLRSLAASCGTDFPCRARLKRISHSVRSAQLILSQPGNIAGCVVHDGGGRVQFAVLKIPGSSWIAGGLDRFCSFSMDIKTCFLHFPWYIFSSYPSAAAPAPPVRKIAHPCA